MSGLIRELFAKNKVYTVAQRMPLHCLRTVLFAVLAVHSCPPLHAQQLTGELGAHDPSSLVMYGGKYYYFATGQGIVSRTSTDKINWTAGPAVFSTPPAWTTQAVPSFTGFFWAPDIAFFNGSYHLYYAVSSFGTIDSAIGVATTTSLANPVWTDQGKVVQSDAIGQTSPNTDTTGYNAIDPSVLVDSDGKVWMAFGSYSSGILVTQLDPLTGKRLNTSTLSATQVANNAVGGGWGSTIEGAALTKHGSYYYLFVNYGGCCSGIDSTYDIRVGRSLSPTGPFLDKDGVDMRNSGGTIFLDDDGKAIGPGHFSTYSEAGQDYFGYHYYNGDTNGAPTYGLRKLSWSTDLWPSAGAVNPDWKGTTNASWGQTGNWSNSVIPNGVGNIANFGTPGAGHATVTLDDGNRTVGKINFQTGGPNFTIQRTGTNAITLDADTGDDATINVQSGTQTIQAPITAVDHLSVNVFAGGAVNGRLNLNGALTAPGMTKYGHGTLALNGTTTFTAPVLVKAGAVEITGAVSVSQYTSVGHAFAETASMTVRGSGSFTTGADLNIGDSGNSTDAATGTLTIQDNAAVTINSTGGLFVGSGFFANSKAVGTVNQSGGTLSANGNFDGAFIIGGRTSTLPTGTYNLSGGTVNANTNVQIGGRATGTMNQTGGTFNAASYVSIGRYSGAVGSWNIGAGTLNQTNAATNLVVGEQGNGTLTLSGTGAINTASATRIGLSAGGSGTLNLNGGTLTTTQVSKGSGTATFNFNGGTLKAGAASTSFLQGLTTTNVDTGGATIDTQAFTITVAQPLLHKASLGPASDGGLKKQGSGTLILTGANSFTGPTVINGGTLRVNGSIAGTATVNTGATLGGTGSISGLVTIADAGTFAPGNSPGTLTIGSLILNNAAQLQIELGGTIRGSQYDAVVVASNAALAGALNVSLINTFAPVLGNTFDILDWGTRSGNFGSINLPALSPGLAWNTTKLLTTGALSVIDANYLPGDVDRNGQVTAADLGAMLSALTDLNAYQATHGSAGGALSSQQLTQILDLTGDNQITNADIQGLINYLSTGNGSYVAVPEPSSLVLITLAILFASSRSRAPMKLRR
jgi:autotransporter-associated beta strand protein